jgi:hypothetical protein
VDYQGCLSLNRAKIAFNQQQDLIMKQDDSISSLLTQFKRAFETLEQSLGALCESLIDDRAHHPFDVVSFTGETNSLLAHEAALDSITRLYYPEQSSDDPLFYTGVLCVSSTSMALADEVNTAKQAFKACVDHIRRVLKNNQKQQLDKLLLETYHKENIVDDGLHDFLKKIGLGRLDLTRCYTLIRLLDEHTVSVSWTWNTRHNKMRQVFYKEAMALAQSVQDEETQTLLETLVSQVSEHQILIQKYSLSPSLRANLVIDPPDQLNVTRKAVTISGMLLCPDPELPVCLWREKPDPSLDGKPRRLPRKVTKPLDAEPYIKKFSLYIREVHDDEPRFRSKQ